MTDRTGNRYRFVTFDVRVVLQVPQQAAAEPFNVYEAARTAVLAMPRFTVPGGGDDTAGVWEFQRPRRGMGPRTTDYPPDR